MICMQENSDGRSGAPGKRFTCVFCKQGLSLLQNGEAYVCNNPKFVCTIPPQLEFEVEVIENPKTGQEMAALWAEEEKRLNNLRKIYNL